MKLYIIAKKGYLGNMVVNHLLCSTVWVCADDILSCMCV